VKKILLIDDDEELCELLADYMKLEGVSMEMVHTGDQGISRALSSEYDLIILDIMLPGMHGLDVLREIRAHSQIPVVMLTARGEDVDRIVGLELGADDYLPKPFNPRELLARMRAVMRRVTPAQSEASDDNPPGLVIVGEMELDIGSRTVKCAGETVVLTSVEFDLLEVLLRAAGSTVTKEELSRKVLGRLLSAYDRSVDVHISNIRKKIGSCGIGSERKERIKTVRGVGYQYVRAPGE
jgi:two-component system, OmpR family, response regulator CpxR